MNNPSNSSIASRAVPGGAVTPRPLSPAKRKGFWGSHFVFRVFQTGPFVWALYSPLALPHDHIQATKDLRFFLT